jgi:hypothetical protein
MIEGLGAASAVPAARVIRLQSDIIRRYALESAAKPA